MKIKRVRSEIVKLPGDEPLANGTVAPGTTRDLVVVKITTADGIEGIGVSFFGAAMTNALKQAVDDLGVGLQLRHGILPGILSRNGSALSRGWEFPGYWRTGG